MITLATAKPAGTDNDVAQLLHDIGEVSANSNPVELFRLCLEAQRVLTNAQTGGVGIPAAAEAVLLASYREMAVDGQARLVGFARQLQGRFPRQRTALTLVRSGQAQSTEAV